MFPFVGVGLISLVQQNSLADYVATKLPSISSERREAVGNAATSASSNQGYSPESVIDAIASCTLYYQKDSTSCFQDTAATTPSVTTTTVGAWIPWHGSGNLTQNTSSARPQFTDDGILFDGSDDRLIRTLSYGTNNTIIVAGRRASGSFQGCFTGGHSYDLDMRCDLFQLQSGNIVTGSHSVAINEKVILSGIRQSGGSKVWKNGIQSGSTNISTLSNVSGSNFYVGSRNDTSIPLNGHIYSVFYAAFTLPDSDRSKIERFANFYNSMSLF